MESLKLIIEVLSVIYIALVSYLHKGWLSITAPIHLPLPTRKVSVIIAARNEEENIGRTLKAILEQHFPKSLLEIIVVDDHSTDRTAEIVRSYADKNVVLFQMHESDKLNSYKKMAIAKAISISTGEIIVTTDADCRMGKDWLATVVGYFEQQDLYMLSSPVVYSEEKSFFERLQTLEFLYLIGLGAAGIGNEHPTTCNGANLAYRKDIFYQMGGFNGIDQLASGDDELLLHKVAESYADKIGFCKDQKAIVYTDAKPTLSSFIQQRKRWSSKSTKYKNKKVILLGVLVWLFNFSLVVLCIAGLTVKWNLLLWFLVVILAKMCIEYVFLRPIVAFVHRRKLLWYLPFLTVLHVFYLVYIGVIGNIGKYDWKDRKVK